MGDTNGRGTDCGNFTLSGRITQGGLVGPVKLLEETVP